jgi:site-specific DNA recombinase
MDGKGAVCRMQVNRGSMIGIYIRESRDDNGENYETIENQKDLLLDYAKRHELGQVYSVYEDDNASGSGFERAGIKRLKEDVLNARIDILLVKDLSRLGRNNAKTLQFLDFLEEYGIRVLSSDGRYDSQLDNDIVGIETWANERYIRDISRKIRSSLRFKIQRGEYIGHAPFGYRKAEGEGNRLFIDDPDAETVRLIYRLYLSGLGYTSIAAILDERGLPSPEGGNWNRITVRRILLSPVYIGNTIQGVSERVSFKNKKTRRLPKEAWVVTEGTHEAIITREEFNEAQKLRVGKHHGRNPHKGIVHMLRGLIWCGGCGSAMYAKKTNDGVAYVCGNYCRNGKAVCKSHFVCEEEIAGIICEELEVMFNDTGCLQELERRMAGVYSPDAGGVKALERAEKQLSVCLRQQEMLYKDRLEGRISEQLFGRTNKTLEERIRIIEEQLTRSKREKSNRTDLNQLIQEMMPVFGSGKLTNEIAGAVVSRVTVFDEGDPLPPQYLCSVNGPSKAGAVVIDFKMK